MNDERVAIIRNVLEKRLDSGEASRLLDALLSLETGEFGIVEEGCPALPWQEGSEDAGALLSAKNCIAELATASRKLEIALVEEEMSALAMGLAMLDVMYLSDFWAEHDWPGKTFGGMALKKREGDLVRGSVNIVFNGAPLGVWLFTYPFPVELPYPSDSFVKEGRRFTIAAAPEREAVSTPWGEWADCLKVVRTVRQEEDAAWDTPPFEETWTVWLAKGVGVVHSRVELADGEAVEMDLAAHHTAQEESYFPMSAGNFWRYEGRTGGRREMWRAFGPPEDGWVWFSLGACGYGSD